MRTPTRYPIHCHSHSLRIDAISTLGLKNPPKKRGNPNNAARERNRVRTLRNAFVKLQKILPSVPPDTKLSKLDILILATTYIRQLSRKLESSDTNMRYGHNDKRGIPAHERRKFDETIMHPVKKWPMRSMFYSNMMTSKTQTYENNNIKNDIIHHFISDRDISDCQRANHTLPYVESTEVHLHEIFPDIFDDQS